MDLLICYNLSVIWPLLRMGDMFREFLSVKSLCLRMRDSCWVPGTKKLTIVSDGQSGDSDRIQTCNLLIRSQMLYSVELRSRCMS